jgi:integrase
MRPWLKRSGGTGPESNPATHSARFEVGPKAHDVPPVEVIQKVLDSLRTSDPIMMLFVRLAATTGARRGEILALSWADIDFENRRVRLVHGIVFPGSSSLCWCC